MYPQQPREGPFDSFTRAVMAGMEFRRQREAEQQAKEERKLRIQALQQEAQRLRLQDKMEAFKMMQGQRGPMVERPDEQQPVLFSPGGQMQLPGPSTMEEQQLPEFDFSELQPGLKLRPQNMGEVLAQQRAQKLMELALTTEGARQKAQAEADVASRPMSVNVPDMGQVDAPANVLPSLLQIISQQREKQAARDFQAGESRLGRESAEKIAGGRNAATLQAAGIQAAATKANTAATREDKMLDDFARDTKDFASLDDAYNKMTQARGAKTPQSDMALMYSYVRMLDPTSAVREGEYATAQNAASVPERIRAAYNRVVGGGLLTDSQRDGFIQAATQIRSGVEPRRQEVLARYRTRAARRGVDPNLFKMESGPRGTTGPIATNDKGERVQWNGSAWVPIQ